MPPPILRPLIKSVPTIAPVPNRSAMSISGSQAGIFLNGMLSSAVQEPMKGPLYSSFLHAQGRILYDVFLYTRTEANGKRGYVLEYDARPSEAKVLFPMLKRYVLRAKVKIRDVTDEYDVWAAWGNPSQAQWDTARRWKWAASGVAEPVWEPDVWPWGHQDESILDRRATGMGRRFLVKKGELPQEAADHNIGTSDDYTLHRILHGVPEGREDLPAMQAFPMDSNLDFMGGVDFRKGCYVGQELTVRTYYTGVIRKRILPVVIHKPDQIPDGTVVPNPSAPKFPVDLDVRPVLNRAPDDPRPAPRPRGYGKLLSSRQGVGLALLRLEHVDAVQRGDLRLEFDVEKGESKGTWGVSHWWPDWWPQRNEADKKEARS